jgi:pyridinium-3,5-bisthiocarboxylic acid mononucleotide nickel chelatase
MIVYFDCVGGAAGDMLLASLLDAGAELDKVRVALSLTGIPGLDVRLERVERHHIGALHVEVLARPETRSRTWSDVREVLDRSGLSDRAHRWAHDAFRRLATAEGQIHGVDPERVHFHEVGAADAIADVMGVCVALDTLQPSSVVCSPLPVARGFVGATHGVLPLPAPATLEILKERGGRRARHAHRRCAAVGARDVVRSLPAHGAPPHRLRRRDP